MDFLFLSSCRQAGKKTKPSMHSFFIKY